MTLEIKAIIAISFVIGTVLSWKLFPIFYAMTKSDVDKVYDNIAKSPLQQMFRRPTAAIVGGFATIMIVISILDMIDYGRDASGNTKPTVMQSGAAPTALDLPQDISAPAGGATQQANFTSSPIDDVPYERNVAPSFDCMKAATEPEKMICSTPILSALDAEMARKYKEVVAKSTDVESLAETQQQWLNNDRNMCRVINCLTFAYKDRLHTLESLLHNQSTAK